MKRIFMVGYSGNKGGVETYINQLTAYLSDYEVIYSLPEMEINGKTWHRPPNRHQYLSYWLFWHRFFKANHFDVLYYNTCDIVSIDMLKFAKKAGIPIRIIHAHNSDIQQAIKQELSLFHKLTECHNRRVLDQYATHLFACSKEAGDWMFDRRSYSIMKNGINISTYSYDQGMREALRSYLGLEKQLLVGIVGRISSQKNPSFAIKVLYSLIQIEPDAKAVFLGDGDLRDEAEKNVRHLGIQESVFFMGNVDNVNEWLSAMDVLLMPSLFEGLPFVLVEAQANGLHCIVSSDISEEANITGLLQFIDLEESPETWADRIIRVKNSSRPDTREQLIEAGYSFEDTAKAVENVIAGKTSKQ